MSSDDAMVVFFEDGPPQDWRRGALALANGCPGLSYGDATRGCRAQHGFLDLQLDEAQSASAARALTTAGISAVSFPASEVVLPPPVRLLLRITVDDLALSCVAPEVEPRPRVPWGKLRLLSLAHVSPLPVPRSAEHVGSGLLVGAVALAGGAGRGAVGRHAQLLRNHTPTPAAPQPEVWLELFTLEPLQRLRIRMHAFVYDCLPVPLEPKTEANLRRLVTLLAARAPRAAHAGLVEFALAGKRLASSAPIELDVAERTVSWHLTKLARG
jgi:hypothetical protein